MNNIAQNQNSGQALRELLAQRTLYSKAKRITLAQFGLAVAAPGALILAEFYHPDLKAWTALTAIVITFVNEAVLEPIKGSVREQAAKIQEAFDSRVLEMPWSDLRAGPPVEREEIVELADINSNTDALRDWYSPDVAAASLPIGRLMCQRTNCFWDSTLRRRYRALIAGILIVVSIGLIAFALWRDLAMVDFVLSIAVPVLPFLLWSFKEMREHSEAADRLDRLRSFVTNCWRQILAGTIAESDLVQASTQLQDAIFDHRRRSPLVFDWLYRWLKKSLQENADSSAREMLQELRDKGRL